MTDFFKTTLRLSEDLNERVRIVMAKRRIRSVQGAVEEALQAWLDSDAPRSSRTDQAAAPEPTEWHRKLTEILKSGDQPTIDAVTQNIDVFHDRLRPARRRKAV